MAMKPNAPKPMGKRKPVPMPTLVAPKKGKPKPALMPKFVPGGRTAKPKAQTPNSSKKIKEMPKPKISKKFNKGY
jgi:hypothetical protein